MILNTDSSNYKTIPSYAFTALLTGIILRLFIVFFAPVHEVPSSIPAFNDETSHRNHVIFRSVVNHTPAQRLSATDAYALERGEVEYSQPPLYYIFAAGILNLSRSTILLRIISLTFWLLALFLVTRFAPNERMRAPLLLAGGLLGVGMIPSATINNDSLLALVTAAIYAQTACAVKKETTLITLMNLGMLAALGVWVKISALTLLPMIMLAGYLGTSGTRKRKLIAVLFILAVTFWMTIPLWYSRISVYGSPISVSMSAGDAVFKPRDAIVSAIYSLLCPWMELWASYLVKIPCILFILALVISGITLFLALIRRKKSIFNESGADIRRILIIWSTGAIFGVTAWAFYGINYHQVDTRLLLPAAPALAILLGWPLWSWQKKHADIAGWALVILCAIPYIAWVTS
ncbi:MAG: hypothetical protein P9L92_04310 [Candidatus Electryonea clarkiae]|nr:hypothetical protein [Candidatus Electryonea clarkiae]MDP8286085.1 hypothetical protein [Candidatus Electryonea clarkiae]